MSLVVLWLYLPVKWETRGQFLTRLKKVKAYVSQLIAHVRTFRDNILAPNKVLCAASRIPSGWFNYFLGLSSSLDREKETLFSLLGWVGAPWYVPR